MFFVIYFLKWPQIDRKLCVILNETKTRSYILAADFFSTI